MLFYQSVTTIFQQEGIVWGFHAMQDADGADILIGFLRGGGDSPNLP